MPAWPALLWNEGTCGAKAAGVNTPEAESLVALASERRLHLLSAPFVQLAPTFRALWDRIRNGAIGRVHSARGLYGNAGSTWACWYHDSKVGPLGDLAIYNLKSLTALLGPVAQVLAAEATAVKPRWVGDREVTNPDPDVSHHSSSRVRSAFLGCIEPRHPALSSPWLSLRN
jgi:predicted dehydrogenase